MTDINTDREPLGLKHTSRSKSMHFLQLEPTDSFRRKITTIRPVYGCALIDKSPSLRCHSFVVVIFYLIIAVGAYFQSKMKLKFF